MDADGEVGAGSETFGCMSDVTDRRQRAARRLVALTRASAPTTSWCAVHTESSALVQELSYAGEQNAALDGTGPAPVYLSRCNLGAVPLPATLTTWLNAVAARCGPTANTAPPVREHRCAFNAPTDVHLRPTPVTASTGRALREGARLQLLERGTLTRQGETIYRVRVVGLEWEGWVFVPPALVPANCP